MGLNTSGYQMGKCSAKAMASRLLSLRPAATALSAGNPRILKLSAAIPATSELLLELIPKYFEPEALAAVSGDREIVSELLQLPFDFIFLTGSVSAGKAVMKAAAEHLTPVVSHFNCKAWFDVIVSKEVLLARPARDTYSLTA